MKLSLSIMDDESKIVISKQELSILSNPEPFLVHKHVKSVFTNNCNYIKGQIIEYNRENDIHFPIALDHTTGKISQGMKYLDLPYFVFDFPRYFSAEQIFNFRLVLVWSKGFSFQFLQKNVLDSRNNFKDIVAEILASKINISSENDLWNHFAPRAEQNKSQLILENNAFKLFELHDVSEFNSAFEKYFDFYKRVIKLLN